MIRSEFTTLLETEFAKIVAINKSKGKDYAGDTDALSNFKTQGKELGLTPEQVLAVYLGKHVSAVMAYCREGQVESEPIEGRIHDVILYCFLLMGLVKEKE